MTPLLVIGYGNELRRDDGVGPKVAQAVVGWGAPGVRAVAVHQLTPELAELLKDADDALFIDAALSDAPSSVRMRPVRPAREWTAVGHVAGPEGLLALTQAVYGRHPRSWLLTVPAHDLSFGEGLSPAGHEGLRQALERARAWIGPEATGESAYRCAGG
jgi:hydrogenase maturation protease